MRAILLSALVVGLTAVGPAFAQPLEVAHGDDLVAWQSLENERLEGADAVVAYRSFVVTYWASPLAEVAWRRLASSDGLDGWDVDGPVRAKVEDVRKRYAAAQATLLRETAVASR